MNMNKGRILNQSYSSYTLFISKCYDSAIACLCKLAVNTIKRLWHVRLGWWLTHVTRDLHIEPNKSNAYARTFNLKWPNCIFQKIRWLELYIPRYTFNKIGLSMQIKASMSNFSIRIIPNTLYRTFHLLFPRLRADLNCEIH